MKIIINFKIGPDLNLGETLLNFVDQSMKYNLTDSVLSKFSIRISYTIEGSDSIVYRKLFTRSTNKGLTSQQIADDVLHKINNRRIKHQNITALHIYLYYDKETPKLNRWITS